MPYQPDDYLSDSRNGERQGRFVKALRAFFEAGLPKGASITRVAEEVTAPYFPSYRHEDRINERLRPVLEQVERSGVVTPSPFILHNS